MTGQQVANKREGILKELGTWNPCKGGDASYVFLREGCVWLEEP